MTIRIWYDSLAITRPTRLRYDPEWDPKTGLFYGYVIRTTATQTVWKPEKPGSPILRENGTEEVPVILLFERACGLLVFAEPQTFTEQVGLRIGLTRSGAGWRLPDTWLDADPWARHPNAWGPCEPKKWGRWYWDVEEVT